MIFIQRNCLTFQEYCLIPYQFIWNNITNFHFRSFNNSYLKSSAALEKKFLWLLHKSKVNKIKKIKPINFNYISNGINHKVIKPLFRNPIISKNEIITKINIEPMKFYGDIKEPLNHTNNKWFKNLSNSHIPAQVTNLVQLGERFSLPTNQNKKLAVHETIKDLESNIKSSNIENQIRIRNTIIPQLHKILHLKTSKNLVDEKLFPMTKFYTKNFCRKNRNVIFTRADKGNVTIALNKSTYIEKIERALQDTNTYTTVKKDPFTIVEKKTKWNNKKVVWRKLYY